MAEKADIHLIKSLIMQTLYDSSFSDLKMFYFIVNLIFWGVFDC